MAKERKDFADPDQLDTLIGKEVVVKGSLVSEGDIQINGYFSGTIESAKDVIIAEHAKVKANIVGENVYVSGELDGDIVASQRLEILETGRVDGNVNSKALSIEPGGILKGSSKMQDTEDEQPESKPTFEVEEEAK